MDEWYLCPIDFIEINNILAQTFNLMLYLKCYIQINVLCTCNYWKLSKIVVNIFSDNKRWKISDSCERYSGIC